MTALLAIYGTEEPVADERVLTAGPLTAILSDGALRSISLGGTEVVRGIYFLIRDRNWATVVPDIRDLAIDEGAEGFRVSFSAHCRTPADGQELVWHARIEATSRGLVFSVEATPGEDFLTCRTGFIVLHPLDRVVGAPVTIEHTDGSIEQTRFPDLIDPLQSFFDIRAMSHEPMPGVTATCRMEGGAWETEDHRNWLDASFKTYFRPLALPWPYTVPAGEKISQKVTLEFSASVAARPVAEYGGVTVAVGDRTGGSMPALSLNAAPDELDEGLRAAGRLRDLGAAQLSLRLRTDQRDLPGVLRRFAGLAAALEVPAGLEIAVADRGDAASELDLVATAAGAAGLNPESVLVTPETDLGSFPPSSDRPHSPPLDTLYEAARRAFPRASIGGGMFNYFTELNRRRPPVSALDFVQHATAANVHAGDDRSVMETLEALPDVFRSGRAFIGNRPYRVGPAAIGMAFNPYGKSTTPNPERLRRTMVTHDPRHHALFGAAYLAGYVARAAQAGIDRLAPASVGGAFSLFVEDQPAPALHVFAGFARLAGAAVLQTASSDPRRLLAIAAEGPAGRELWLASLTPNELEVGLSGLRPAGVGILDATAAGFREGDLSAGQLRLGAYQVARVKW